MLRDYTASSLFPVNARRVTTSTVPSFLDLAHSSLRSNYMTSVAPCSCPGRWRAECALAPSTSEETAMAPFLHCESTMTPAPMLATIRLPRFWTRPLVFHSFSRPNRPLSIHVYDRRCKHKTGHAWSDLKKLQEGYERLAVDTSYSGGSLVRKDSHL